MPIALITIQVTPDIAAKIRGLADAGVFAIEKGSASMNFDGGILKSVKTEIYTYPTPIQVDTIFKNGIILE